MKVKVHVLTTATAIEYDESYNSRDVESTFLIEVDQDGNWEYPEGTEGTDMGRAIEHTMQRWLDQNFENHLESDPDEDYEFRNNK